jgi:very-short-patch-repair endonuclease
MVARMREETRPRRPAALEDSFRPVDRDKSRPRRTAHAEASFSPAIARLAARQRGLVTRPQLLELGVGASAIGRQVADGRLHPVLAGVYLVGHPVAPPLAFELAALLACGQGAVLSHRSAAALWRLLPPAVHPVDVTVVHRRGPAKGVRLHRSGALGPAEVRVREGLRVTSPARTLVDLAATDAAAFPRAFDEVIVERLLTRADLDGALTTPRRGTRALRAALDAGPAPTRSAAERRLLDVVAKAALPRPETNVRVGRHEVDALWAAQRLVVEVDGYAAHTTRRAFEADRLRDAELQAGGHRVLRVTWRQLTDRPHAVAARLAVALAQRPAG